ncbi:MAG: Gfo/Idh/MocA family oxidoreductase [Alphaproteobacteria bacterium]|nr:Gfo/Idh/MocA family oxidoreductase [Alphaproteobacteria bacterium]
MRIGCLGAARITPNAIIHPARVRPGAVLQSVAARDPARARSFAQAHGFKRHDEDYAALVRAPDIDIVYNALPINLHAEWSIKALEAGKHVICEKPFAMNVREAAQVLAAARATGKRVIEAFHYRYHPGFLQALAWIDAGEIGLISSIDAVFNIGIDDRGGTEIRHLPETGGGAFMDLGCYPLSWTLNILRTRPVHVEAKASVTPRGVDEKMEATLVFPGAITARLSASMAAGEAFAARLHVKGSKGEIVFANPLVPHHGGVLTLKAGQKTLSPRISRISTYTWQLDTILFALEAQVPVPTEGEAIIMQQEVIDGVYAAAGLKALRYL